MAVVLKGGAVRVMWCMGTMVTVCTCVFFSSDILFREHRIIIMLMVERDSVEPL